MKYIIVMFLLTNIYASNSAKLLVVDKNIYEKIENLNLLNDGLKKRYLISSIDINEKDLKRLYPEYFIYNGAKCNIINEVSITNIDTLKSDIIKIKDKTKKEIIKKIRLLQILADDNSNEKINSNDIQNKILNLGFICDDKLLIRNRKYNVGDVLGDKKINLIDNKKSIVYLIKDN